MYQTCSFVCKVEEFKPTSNNFRTEFIGKDWTGRKQYRGISFKKTQFGNIEDINYATVAPGQRYDICCTLRLLPYATYKLMAFPFSP